MTNTFCNYDDISNFVKPSSKNYIPVRNYADFTVDVYTYYNQYYASPYVTQQRRILRNYINNNNTIKQNNINPFINNKNIKFNFVYGEAETYMVVQNANKSIDIYIKIGVNWCLQRHFDKIKLSLQKIYI